MLGACLVEINWQASEMRQLAAFDRGRKLPRQRNVSHEPNTTSLGTMDSGRRRRSGGHIMTSGKPRRSGCDTRPEHARPDGLGPSVDPVVVHDDGDVGGVDREHCNDGCSRVSASSECLREHDRGCGARHSDRRHLPGVALEGGYKGIRLTRPPLDGRHGRRDIGEPQGDIADIKRHQHAWPVATRAVARGQGRRGIGGFGTLLIIRACRPAQ